MTASRPARAMRGAAMLLTLVMAFRVPAIEQRFAAALAAAAGPRPAPLPRRGVRREPPAVPAAALWRSIAAGGEPAVPAAPRPSRVLVRVPAVPAVVPPVTLATTPTPPVVTLAAAAPLAALVATAAAPPDPGALATAAYARLAVGDRRDAVRLFDAALAGDDPRRAAWRHQRDALTRRWSGSAYSIVRGSGPAGLAVEPVLGGGQSGAAIAFTPDPLSARPFALTARGSVAHDDGGRSAFAALGAQWHPFPGITVAAERLIAIGPAAPNTWTARLAAGTDRTAGRWRATAYGEAGVIGHAAYAAVQGRAAAVFRVAAIEIDPGVGIWSSVQRDRGATVDRADVGPGVVVRGGPFAAEVDYRVRAAGNAVPGSGPVLTLSAHF